MDPNNSYAILGRAAGDGDLVAAMDRAIKEENECALREYETQRLIDPHFPRLITRRAAENLVKEHPGIIERGLEPVIDCTGVERMSVEYARELMRLWPNVM